MDQLNEMSSPFELFITGSNQVLFTQACAHAHKVSMPTKAR